VGQFFPQSQALTGQASNNRVSKTHPWGRGIARTVIIPSALRRHGSSISGEGSAEALNRPMRRLMRRLRIMTPR